MARRLLIGTCACLLLMTTLNGSVAFAQDQATPPAQESATSETLFSVRPEGGSDGDRFEVELAPGATASLTVLLANAGTIPMELHSFTSDVKTAANGGLTMEQEDTELHAPTTWMQFPSETVALTPGQEVAREFTITVPEGTAPGQYVNAIAVQTVDDYAIEGSSNFRQRVRKVLAVYITVPGDLQGDFTLGQPEVEYRVRGPVILVPLQNTGNVRLRPHGEVTVNDPTGVELMKAPVAMGSVFGGHNTVVEVRMNAMLPPGEYLLSASLVDDESGATSTLDNIAFQMPEPEVEAAANPIAVQSMTVTPNASPIQFADVALEIANGDAIVPSSRLTVSVFRNGELVEDFVLADSLVLNPGITTVQQRYIPITGFESGTYTFAIKLESVDSNSGVATVLLNVDNVATLEVP